MEGEGELVFENDTNLSGKLSDYKIDQMMIIMIEFD